MTNGAKFEFFNVSGIPNVLGAVDGSLINIFAPSVDEHVYVNRKGNHSLNILCVCDIKMLYTYAVTKYPGSAHDSYIFENSTLATMFENGTRSNGWLLGDSGFGLSPYLMTPILNPQNDAEERYDHTHRKTRVVIENCFGLTKRFRCWHKSGGALTYSPNKCCKIITACLILHNMCVRARLLVDEDDDEMHEDEDNDENDEHQHQEDQLPVPNRPMNNQARRTDGRNVRQQMINTRFTR